MELSCFSLLFLAIATNLNAAYFLIINFRFSSCMNGLRMVYIEYQTKVNTQQTTATIAPILVACLSPANATPCTTSKGSKEPNIKYAFVLVSVLIVTPVMHQ